MADKQRRLTVALRKKIRYAMLAHAFTDELKAHQEKRRVFALKVLNAAWGEHKNAAERMPDAFFPSSTCAHVRFMEKRDELSFDGWNNLLRDWGRRLGIERSFDKDSRRALQMRVPEKMDSHHNGWRFDRSDPLYDEWEEVCVSAQRKLRERIEQTSTEIKAVLDEFKTIRQLELGWPEAVEFVPPPPAEPKAGLPVNLTDLTARLKPMPSETGKAVTWPEGDD